MTNLSSIYKPGDYVQATKSLKKIFCVKAVNKKGITLERVSAKTNQTAFFPWSAINYPTAFFHADLEDAEIKAMIETYEINKYLDTLTLEELFAEF